MLCRKCERESPEGAQFCAHCGNPLTERAAPAPRKFPYWAIGVLLAVVLMVVVFTVARPRSGVAVAPPSPTPQNVAQAPAQTPANNLAQGMNKPAEPSQVATGSNVQPAQAPKEVVEYLKKMEAIEAVRKSVANDGSIAASMLQSAYSGSYDPNDDNSNPSKKVMDGYHSYITRLQTLATQVGSMPTPQPCMPFANSYLAALQSHITMINGIRDAIQKGDISAVMSMQNKLSGPYTAALQQAESDLDKVCKSTGAEKKFTVSD